MIATAIYRGMLALYPADFRHEYGPEMRDQFRDDWAEARARSLAAALLFWLHLVRDWALSVLGSHGEIARQDLAAAIGGLRRRPASTAALVGLFSLVLGGNTVTLVLAARLVIQPLLAQNFGAVLFLAYQTIASTNAQEAPLAVAQEFGRASRTLQDVGLARQFEAEVAGLRWRGFMITPAALRALGMTTISGKVPADDDRNFAVVSARLWEHLHRSNGAGDGELRLFGTNFHVTGVAGPRPIFAFEGDLWLAPQQNMFGVLLARLKPGVSLKQAQAEWSAWAAAKDLRMRATLTPLDRLGWNDSFHSAVWVCQGAFFVALLLACAELAFFQFGYILLRQREIAIRLAVGVSRGRLLRFLLTETLLLAAVAGALSVPLAAGCMEFLHSRLDPLGVTSMWGWTAVRFDALAAFLTVVVSLGSGALAGGIPAWRFVNRHPWELLGASRSGRRAPARRLKLALLAAEIAFAVPILFTAAALGLEGRGRLESPAVRSFDRSWRVALNPRQNPLRALETVTGRLESAGYATILSSVAPFVDAPDPLDYESGGRHNAGLMRVNPRFFQIAGFRWLQGRAWSDAEARRAGPVPIVVNRALLQQAGRVQAEIVLLNQNKVRVPARIIGVIDHPPLTFYESIPGPMIFFPYQRGPLSHIEMIVAGASAPPTIERVLSGADLNPALPPRTFEAAIRRSWIVWQYTLGIVWLAALLALALTATGAAAYLTQTLNERRTEVALRCALGSLSREIWIWVIGQIRPALLLGAVVAAGIGSLLWFLPSGMVPLHGAALFAAVLAFALVWGVWAVLAWIASRRASGGHWMDSLREA